jgi:hypothetical protein
MKQASVVATIILAVAVLLAAYAIGRLIRQARLDAPQPSHQQVAEPNDVDQPNAMISGRRINRPRKELTPEEKARNKQERADKLAQNSNLTDEEKAKRRDEMRQKLRPRRAEPGQVPQMSPEELEALAERWPQMSEEEKEQAKAAFRARMRGQGRQRPRRSETAASSPDAPAAEAKAAEPNAVGQD